MAKGTAGIDPQGFTTFGDLLRYLRERAHLTQRELAALVGYHFSFISYLEKNTRTMDESTLLGRFVPALGVEDEPIWVARLVELGKAKKNEIPLSGPAVEPAPSVKNASSLPTSLTSLIGREYESARLRKLILDPEIRLVSVLGPPGVGKTCLTLNIVRKIFSAFRDGVVFVDLTPVRSPAMVLPALALALGVPEISKTPLDEGIKAELSEKNLLLVLDNFEQVVDAAPQLLVLLGAASEVKILVTSREVLRLRGEHEFHLLPLPLPAENGEASLEKLQDVASVGLFVERAQAVKPEFSLDEKNASYVTEICSRLDGLPLAIELAAARLRTMSLVSMSDQLGRRFDWLTQGARDLPAWRQTLHGAVEWSIDLLSEQERTLFQRLSIFTGGWTLEAAEEVCDDEAYDARGGILNLLVQLIDKSLVLPEDENGHFNFLETLREFAFESLQQRGEYENLQQRHCAYFLKFMQNASVHIKQGKESLVWLNRVEREYNNLRQALAWSVETPERSESAEQLGAAIHIFWLSLGYLTEARSWLLKILALDTAPTAIRANLLRYASDYASSQGDFTQARLFEEEAMGISRSLGDEAGIYYSMDGIAMMAGMQGDYVQAVDMLEQILVYRRRTGEALALAGTLNNLALATRLSGNLERAAILYKESIMVTREAGITSSLSRALNGMADVYAQQKDFSSAVVLLRESILLRHQFGDLKGLVASLNSISYFTEQQGEKILAVKLEGAAARIRHDIGFPISPGMRADNDALILRLRNDLGKQYFENAWFDGQTMSQKQLIELIETTPLFNGKTN